jgi:glycine cleavage system H protein
VVNNYELLRGLYYSKDYLWIELESGTAKIGITDYAQKQLREIVYVELSNPPHAVNQLEPFGTIESVKAVSDLIAPLSSIIEKANDRVRDRPELLNEDPYGKGWLMIMSPSNVSGDLGALMDFDVAIQWYRQLSRYT